MPVLGSGMRRLLLLLVVEASCQQAGVTHYPVLDPGPLPITRFSHDSSAYLTYSGIVDSLHVVVRDPRQWREYWQRIHSPFFPRPSEPSIDFKSEMVVLVALGRRPSLGFDIAIQGAILDRAGIEILLRRLNPSDGCPVGAAITGPVDVARIPASSLPVRFTERITRIPCSSQDQRIH